MLGFVLVSIRQRGVRHLMPLLGRKIEDTIVLDGRDSVVDRCTHDVA
jgi:hypothetical protein